jgi:hypothetical protein
MQRSFRTADQGNLAVRPRADLQPAQVAAPLVLVAAITLLKGLRMPSAWVATHLTFNYSQGFVRRGLVGEVLYRLHGCGGPQHYNGLAVFAIAWFVLVVGATGWLMRRALAAGRGDLGLAFALLVFLASPALVFFVHIIGYLDDFAVLYGVGFVMLASRARRHSALLVAALVGGAVLALVHEMLTWSFSPAIAFALLCCAARDASGARPSWRRWGSALGAWIGLLGEALAAGVLGTRSPARINALVQSVAPRVDFPLRGDAFDVLHRSLAENLTHLMPYHWSQPGTIDALVRTTLTAAPGILFLIVYGVHVLGAMVSDPRWRRLLVAAFVLATLSPHVLNLVGWDTGRWNAISLWTAFLCVASMRLVLAPVSPKGNANLLVSPVDGDRGGLRGPGSESPAADRIVPYAGRTVALSPWLWAAGLVALVLGLCANTELFDGYVVQWFPFEGQWRSALDLWRGHFHFIPRY